MAYTKINPNETTVPLSPANLNHMETQYDEALDYSGEVRADPSTALCAEVVSGFPAHAAGKLVYHSGNGKGYFSTGSLWIEAFVPTDSGVS